MSKKEIVAMILAGGQGTRLGALTKNIAKPAVPYGGKYRIIDFALSNCLNSGINTVGILTQYKPRELNSHIGIGAPWDLDRRDGGVSLLSPYKEENDGGDWYSGTANAIYKNLEYIDNYDPEYVLILSGDQIYKMDYSKMLEYHKKNKADATIAVIEVTYEEAKRFGIMNTNDDLSIYEFEEKPKNPKGTLASMGIYIFNWKVLRKYLIDDAVDETSENDFGKNIIPNMLNDGHTLFAYPFKGYWKDVGTIESFWEASMDLLRKENELNLYDNNWRICTVNSANPPQYIGSDAVVKNALINEGCTIFGTAENSILFDGVYVGKNTVIKDSVIMPNVKIGDNVVIEKAIIASDAQVLDDAKVGNGEDIAVIAERKVVKA
ncbi:glucose-1-phosphate adenylyltransferase [Clostridium sp. MSJ-8]|uniref:glucose-1-phosphate adenylyltransferase n=1 Tax=Clostridium sp. MSJ-8 TaxID=2841510 RepID=UPI001C0E937A|nr:glucose-1-phosphate adenylyltransferase [Clostridium sp. MSJ-8]MBU5487075.1 glucose-1-phosphate adenylyltransferase [Clostridium sp. MSJ-8]